MQVIRSKLYSRRPVLSTTQMSLLEHLERESRTGRGRVERLNRIGMVAFCLALVLFNLFFWTVVLGEYLRPPEDYLVTDNA